VKVRFSTRAWDDYLWWQSHDQRILRRINALIADIARNGNEGIGKPELLRYTGGYWSRRINDEHRMVYRIADDEIQINACRYHYGRWRQREA
jgi:toxin YoeB